jgi:hypothetical protein
VTQELLDTKQAPQTHNESASILAMIARAARDQNADIDKMERLMAMYERKQAMDAEQEFNAAMCAAQGEMGRISADCENPQTRSKYASYAALDRALRPIYTRHGFALSGDTAESANEGSVIVLFYVTHKAGYKRTYRLPMPSDGKGAKGNDVMTKTHATGSAVSYGMRYLLKLIFNVAIGEDDDDGNAANGPGLALLDGAQVEEVLSLLAKTGSDTAKFLSWVKANSVSEIPAAKYQTVVQTLRGKLPKSEGEATEAT